MNINKRILIALEYRNLTQKELCVFLDIAPSTLNNWLKLNRSIPSEQIIPICEFLDIDINWLLTGVGEMYKDSSTKTNKIEIKEVLPTDEEMLLKNYRKMDNKQKLLVQDTIVDMLISPISRAPDSKDDATEEYGATTMESTLKKEGKSNKKFSKQQDISSSEELEDTRSVLHN